MSELEIEIEVAEEVELPLFLQEKLDRAINEKIDAQITAKTRTIKYITSVIKKELLHFKIEGKRKPNLERCYQD